MKKFIMIVLALVLFACAPQAPETQVPTVIAAVISMAESTPTPAPLTETPQVAPASFPLSSSELDLLREFEVQTSEGYPKEGDFVFINSENGSLIGFSGTLLIPLDGVYTAGNTSTAGCFIKSLEYSGEWTVQDAPPLVIDLQDYSTWKTWDSLGLSKKEYQNGKILPDFCGRNYLEEYPGEISWVETHDNGVEMYSYIFSGFTVEIHTNSEKCDLYDWPDKEFFIVVIKFEGKFDQEYILKQGDLLKLEEGGDQGFRSVYITVAEHKPIILWNRWEYSYNDSSLTVSGYCEGHGVCVDVSSTPLPYLTEKWGFWEQSAPITLP